MRTIHRSQPLVLGLAALLAVAVLAPVAAEAEDEVLAVAPAAGLAWDATSGYGALELSRATTAIRAPLSDDWDETSGYGALEASRAAIAIEA